MWIGTVLIFCVCAPASGDAASIDAISARLQDGKVAQIYADTYASLLGRVEPDGFFQESMTGAYAGMFPRTVGGLVSLFLETGELDACERLVGCVLEATRVNGMERVPHVFGRKNMLDVPMMEPNQLVQPDSSTTLFRLDGGRAGGQSFAAPSAPLRAFEAYLTLPSQGGALQFSLGAVRDAAPLLEMALDVSGRLDGPQWVRFEFPHPLPLEAGRVYSVVLRSEGVRCVWWGRTGEPGSPWAGAFARDSDPASAWLERPDLTAACAIDTGTLRHEKKELLYPIISDRDEVDGQAHIIMAWGRLAARRGPTPFEDRTYGAVAKLLDRSTDWPYILSGGRHADLGLVRNVSLEHSREGRMWDTYDILTQSFVGAALDAMIPVAERRGDQQHVNLWKGRLERLRAAVAAHLLRELDGKTVYLEMRLPNSDEGVPFEGMGWLNLSPVAAQWEPCEAQILRNTVEALRARDLKAWHGLKYLGTDWLPDTGASPQVIGKGVGWEIDYARREGEWARVLEWFDFIEAVNDTPLYMEGANYIAEKDIWQLQDSGNGEQCAWWCWSIARLRKQVGLPPR